MGRPSRTPNEGFERDDHKATGNDDEVGECRTLRRRCESAERGKGHPQPPAFIDLDHLSLRLAFSDPLQEVPYWDDFLLNLA